MNTNDATPVILKEEVAMKNGKASELTVDILKEGNDAIEVCTELFKKCITLCDVLNDWENAIKILCLKKGEKEDIRNYRPISLFSVLCKILMKVLINRFSETIRCSLTKRTSKRQKA